MTVGSKQVLSGKGYRMAAEGKASYGRTPMKVSGKITKPFYSGKYYKVRAGQKYRRSYRETRDRRFYPSRRRRFNRW